MVVTRAQARALEQQQQVNNQIQAGAPNEAKRKVTFADKVDVRIISDSSDSPETKTLYTRVVEVLTYVKDVIADLFNRIIDAVSGIFSFKKAEKAEEVGETENIEAPEEVDVPEGFFDLCT